MIKFANEHTAPLVRKMWKICFEDIDESMYIHFTYKYKNENTLIYFEGNEPAASLQMLPYTITFYGEEIPFVYLAGLCTYPKYRKKGYMSALIDEAHRVIAKRNIPLAILIPADESLYNFYRKYGYEQVFEEDETPIPLKKILETHGNDNSGYQAFNSLFRDQDFCVQKNEADFKVIVKELKLEGFPMKTNLSGMARIIDLWLLLDLYAKENSSKKFRIKIANSSENSSVYSIDKGRVDLILGPDVNFDIEVDICLLCRLLFGFKTKQLNDIFQPYFKEHHPIMNLMLE